MQYNQTTHIVLIVRIVSRGFRIAYTYVNSYVSVYNNRWCNYVSAQLHEIGHNLNLAHSSEGSSTYGDQSGMMGYSYASDDGPIMCFNPGKSWNLGWYTDRHATADPLSQTWTGTLVGVADYANSGRKYLFVDAFDHTSMRDNKVLTSLCVANFHLPSTNYQRLTPSFSRWIMATRISTLASTDEQDLTVVPRKLQIRSR